MNYFCNFPFTLLGSLQPENTNEQRQKKKSPKKILLSLAKNLQRATQQNRNLLDVCGRVNSKMSP